MGKHGSKYVPVFWRLLPNIALAGLNKNKLFVVNVAIIQRQEIAKLERTKTHLQRFSNGIYGFIHNRKSGLSPYPCVIINSNVAFHNIRLHVFTGGRILQSGIMHY